MRFWALGHDCPQQTFPWYTVLFHKLTRQPLPAPLIYYKRLVSAVRLKNDEKLMLKGYKDIPTGCLEHLLPDARVKMTNFDKSILLGTFTVGVGGIFARSVVLPPDFESNFTAILTGLCGLVCVRGWTVYKNRKNRYLAELTRMLYFKNIANNRSLLAVLVDRAEEEILKEALLTYVFLLMNRRVPSLKDDAGVSVETGGVPSGKLERIIEGWIHMKTGEDIEFDCQDSVDIMRSFGILSKESDGLHVLPMDSALGILPELPESGVPRPGIDVEEDG